jgi:DtxR family Mn-dependent transcriptional regulator
MQSLSRKAEDYLEAILNVTLEKGYARIKDIAAELSVQPPTVVEMARKLDRQGMITYRKYDGVTLTPAGRRIAEIIRDRHETLQSFLEMIRIPEQIASKDACIMEHELSPETIEQIRAFVRFIREYHKDGQILRQFDTFRAVKSVVAA